MYLVINFGLIIMFCFGLLNAVFLQSIFITNDLIVISDNRNYRGVWRAI